MRAMPGARRGKRIAALTAKRHGAQMIEPWLYPALTAVAVLTGFVDAIAGGGG
jgi:hypothetical protein